jgi:prepilin-type processing-associated H-X9-DG protein
VINDTRPIKNTPKGYHYGWLTQILPLLDRKAVYQHLDFSVGLYDPINLTCRQTLISTFLCPSDPGRDRDIDDLAISNYAGCHHDSEVPIDVNNNGVFFLNSRIRYEDIADGTSQTIFVGEKRSFGGDLGWASGTRSTLRNSGEFAGSAVAGTGVGTFTNSQDRLVGESEVPDPVGGFGSAHPGGSSFLFGDGSVRFVRNSAKWSVFRLLMNRADGVMLNAKDY